VRDRVADHKVGKVRTQTHVVEHAGIHVCRDVDAAVGRLDVTEPEAAGGIRVDLVDRPIEPGQLVG
jgi:hypothetical protein